MYNEWWNTNDQLPPVAMILPVICVFNMIHRTNFAINQHARPLDLMICDV